MKLKTGDKIRTTINRINQTEVTADTSQFSNVEKIHIEPNIATTKLSPGKELFAEISEITNSIAKAEQIRAAYSKRYWPGDRIEVRADEMLTEGLYQAKPTDLKNLERIIVADVVPLETVQIELIKIRDSIGFGTVVDRVTSGIQIGDTIAAWTSGGGHIAETNEGSFEITLNTYAPVPSDIYVQITAITSSLEGIIIGPETYPYEGASVQATINQGNKKAYLTEHELAVTIDKPAQVSGTADITLEVITKLERAGRIEIDSAELPDIGDRIPANVSREQRSAPSSASEFSIDIILDKPAPVDGIAIIELTDVSHHEYQGTIAKYGDKPIIPGATHSGQVYKHTNRLISKEYNFTIQLTHEVNTAGHATARITKIAENIFGEIVGEIDPKETSNEESYGIGSKNTLINQTDL
jgi:hypothetical protein